jgi:hypothetical protein
LQRRHLAVCDRLDRRFHFKGGTYACVVKGML